MDNEKILKLKEGKPFLRDTFLYIFINFTYIF